MKVPLLITLIYRSDKMENATKFSNVFRGLDQAYGTYRIDKEQSNGKQVGKATLVREPRTVETWEKHLDGTGNGIGIVPINEDNKCVFGAIDVDTYPLDLTKLVQQIRKLKLPLVVCRSKSGGAHCYFFTSQWIDAKAMQEVLNTIASALGYHGSEVFPKQILLRLDRGDVGNFLNMPYFNAEKGLRYAIKDDGSAATLSEFFEMYDQYVQTPEQVSALKIEESVESPVPDGPPCLQHLCAQKISEGGRNNGLFNVGVYLRKANPEDWQSEILAYNMNYIVPPLPLNEVNMVAKQLQKKDYAYRCRDAPINAYCNAELCKTRKFGIGAAISGAVMANLRKYNSAPPVWFIDINSLPVELETDALMSQAAFQRSCIEQINFMPKSLVKLSWEGKINALLQEMLTTDGSIMEVSQDASVTGQFYDHLEDFCCGKQQATDRDEILLRRPYTDEDESRTYFRLKDFETHLKKNKFFEFKSHKIAQRLRDINGRATSVKIKGKSVRVWWVPAFTTPVEIFPAALSLKKEQPF